MKDIYTSIFSSLFIGTLIRR